MTNTVDRSRQAPGGALVVRVAGLLVAVIVFVASTLTGSAEPRTLVNVTFDGLAPGQSPPLLGSAPPASLPSDRLVGMNFGSAVVVDNVPGMSQAIQLVPGDYSYSQPVVFNQSVLPSSGSTFHFEMDFLLSGFETSSPNFTRSVDELGILFDFPRVNRMDFTTDGSRGQVSIGTGTPLYVGHFTFDTAHHVGIDLNLDLARWSATLDGNLLFTNAYLWDVSDGTALKSLRINLLDDVTLAGNTQAYLDNIRLTELTAIPEPQSLHLLLLGGGVLWIGGRRRIFGAVSRQVRGLRK